MTEDKNEAYEQSLTSMTNYLGEKLPKSNVAKSLDYIFKNDEQAKGSYDKTLRKYLLEGNLNPEQIVNTPFIFAYENTDIASNREKELIDEVRSGEDLTEEKIEELREFIDNNIPLFADSYRAAIGNPNPHKRGVQPEAPKLDNIPETEDTDETLDEEREEPFEPKFAGEITDEEKRVRKQLENYEAEAPVKWDQEYTRGDEGKTLYEHLKDFLQTDISKKSRNSMDQMIKFREYVGHPLKDLKIYNFKQTRDRLTKKDKEE